MKTSNRLVRSIALGVLPLSFTLAAPSASAAADTSLKIGGALRYNYVLKYYDYQQHDRLGDIDFDTFRFNVDGHYNKWLVSAEYRFYQTWNALHHGWIGYQLNPQTKMEFGLNKVPFGLMPFASHNFWFSGTYYIGLEDQYDLGLKGVYSKGPWDFAAGFYKNSDFGDNTDTGRYSIDVIQGATSKVGGYAGYDPNSNNMATNELATRLAYTFGKGSDASTEVGLSAQAGQLYNSDTRKNGDHFAVAAHLDGHYGRWNPQLEVGRYQYNPKNPAGVQSDTINMGAYNYAWGVPASATFGIVNLAYKLPVSWGPLNSLTFYSDNTVIQPDKDKFNTIWQNVIGTMIASGPVYTYIDLISGKNMIFDGGNMVSTTSEKRMTRLNINVGYYF
ncbi:MAG: hypothetical protein P8Y64_08260 [Gammaproteobacteria bacterium]